MLRYLETTISDRKPENTSLFSLVKAWENRNTTQASKKQLQRKSKQFSCPLRMDINCNEKDSAQIQKKIVPRYHPRSAGTDQLEKSWGFKKCFYNHLSGMMEVELIFLLWSSPQPYFLWQLCWPGLHTALGIFWAQCWLQGLATTRRPWKPAKGNPTSIKLPLQAGFS